MKQVHVRICYSSRMLAQLLRLALFAAVLPAIAMAFLTWKLGGGLWAIALAMGSPLLLHWGLMACVFGVVYVMNRHEPTPPVAFGQWVASWWLECLTEVKVFAWRQPFRSHTHPDFLPPEAHEQCGVVLVHGFLCNRAFWQPWCETLRATGTPFIAVNLEPVFGSINHYPALLETAIEQMVQATGKKPLLVCHSMGGLAARAWLRTPGNADRVGWVVTIGTPHHGTALSWRTIFSNTRQMGRFSAWVQDLDRNESPSLRAKLVCWYSQCDNIVAPASTATLQGADNRLVNGLGHCALAYDPVVMRESLALRERHCP
jgi:triacylglycerol lipase